MNPMTPKTIAIVGGGPAGAMAAEKLARSGAAGVIVFEEKPGWEKPCGGGLSHKALSRYPFLAEATGAGKYIRDIEFVAGNGASVKFRLRKPLAVYARSVLNQLLLHRAQEAGAEVVADHIVGIRSSCGGWELAGRKGSHAAGYLILAAGARTRLRRMFSKEFSSRDLMLTYGYYLPSQSDVLRIQFFEDYEGYAWAFPRPNHISVGICGAMGKESMAKLQARLHDFMHRFGYVAADAPVFSHLLPALSPEGWENLRLQGAGWAIVGDAAGLVDPVTGEGIYYGMRSGELLAEAWLEGLPDLYPERVRDEFGRALALGARLTHLFYHGDFLGAPVTTRLVEFGARSQKFREVLQDLVEGTKSYPGLPARLYVGLTRTLFEVGAGLLREAWHEPAIGRQA